MELIRNIILLLSIVSIPTLALESSYKQQSRCEIINKNTGRAQRLDCLLDPETVEGPYYLPLNLSRSDITESHPGVPLNLNLIIMDTSTCAPVQNAIVDIWYCNASGIYSGYEEEGTLGETYLRGVQVSDENGEVNFETIFPGWYTGRSIHIHIEVFVGGSLKHTGQFFFTSDIATSMLTVTPYSSNTQTLMYNDEDWIYSGSNGNETIFDLVGSIDAGFSSIMYVGVEVDEETTSSTTSRVTITTSETTEPNGAINLFNSCYTFMSIIIIVSFATLLIFSIFSECTTF